MTAQALNTAREDFRREALVVQLDGTDYLIMDGKAENDNGGYKAPFNPHVVNGIDDGDPHMVWPSEPTRLTSECR
jgi:hypothetical protein